MFDFDMSNNPVISTMFNSDIGKNPVKLTMFNSDIHNIHMNIDHV
jgi:hypothetical protein